MSTCFNVNVLLTFSGELEDLLACRAERCAKSLLARGAEKCRTTSVGVLFLKVKGGKTTREHSGAIKRI